MFCGVLRVLFLCIFKGYSGEVSSHGMNVHVVALFSICMLYERVLGLQRNCNQHYLRHSIVQVARSCVAESHSVKDMALSNARYS